MRTAVISLVVVMFSSAWLCGCTKRKTVTIEVEGLEFPEPVKMRDPVINYSWSWQRGWTHFDGYFGGTTAESGHDYVLVYIRVQNMDSEEIYVDAGEFEMVGSDGKVYSEGLVEYPRAKGVRPLCATLLPGGTDSGYIIFEMKTWAEPVELRYNPRIAQIIESPEEYELRTSE